MTSQVWKPAIGEEPKRAVGWKMELTRWDWIVLHVRCLWRNRHYRWRLARSHAGGVWLLAGVLVAFMGQFKSVIIQQARRLVITGSIAGWIVASLGPCDVLAATGGQTPTEVRIVELQGTVEVLPKGAVDWVLTQTNQILRPLARLRTGPNSRVALWWSDQSVARFNEQTEIELLPPHEPESLPGLHLIKGLFSFLHRDKPGRIRVVTRGAVAGVEGTEFVLAVDTVDNTERTTLSLIDGRIRFTNEQGELTLTNGQQAVAEPGRRPVLTAGFIVNNVLQWAFYYPAVLDLSDLALPLEAKDALLESLAAYRDGDLLTALARYPPQRQPGSDAERIYYAALLLSVGQVDKTEAALDALPIADHSAQLPRLANALRTLIAAVKLQPAPSSPNPRFPTEFLASSYYEQSRAVGDPSLRSALALARQAVALSPGFSFAWARVAELEFSFGHTGHALDALNKSLELSPRNAQALALKGFLLAAENKTRAALDWFNQALAVDSALGNAWLGRGLCRIRHGDAQGGREDLLVAAALEPQRALLRSYLGKAYADRGDDALATKELELSRKLDPNDPTGWLYSALLKQQQNRINEAISDLEASQERNDNRCLFRSRLLLDQDRAVRSANLASIYRDAGMLDVSVREAARAVTYDYANDAAHLFLSDSYNELRDPTRFNLRYETVWFNELLLANLLSPVGGGRLSQHVSQQEYSRLFEADGLGLANSTLVRSDGVIRELASQFGTFGRTSYSLDLDYEHHDGVRPNNELDSIEWYTTVKQQITPQDTVLALVKYQDYHSGDNFQYYDPTNARPHFRFDECQDPVVVGGWHHEWAPGVHTLLLGGRLENEQRFRDLGAPQFLITTGTSSTNAVFPPFDLSYHGQLEIYTAELNQIFQRNRLTLSAGARYQWGTFDTSMTFTNPPGLVYPPPFGLFTNAVDTTRTSEDFERITGYAYLTAEPLDRLWVTVGVAYDQITFPRNFRHPPISSGEDHRSQIGPKASLVWEPLPQATVRGFFARSLGGVSLDESYRLEQTQLAGFPQTFRNLIPESVVGSVAAPDNQTYGAALDLKFASGTYAGLQYERLESDVQRTIGYFLRDNGIPPYVPRSTRATLDYREHLLRLSLHQLFGQQFAAGVSYKFDHAQLREELPDLPALPGARQKNSAELHEVSGYLLCNHSSGLFARVETHWYHQSNSGYESALASEDFFQHNLFVGCRFARRRAELMLGILNLTGQDYHLNPLTVYSELPRERTFMAQLRFRF